jgi:hypothetical protein
MQSSLRSPHFRNESYLTGKDTEPGEILYFTAYKSQLPVLEQALETAGLMLGSDKSRGYCLEMICPDFLAGVSLEAGSQDALLPCLIRLVLGLPKLQREQLLKDVQVTLWQGSVRSGLVCGLNLKLIASFAGKFWSEIAGVANGAGAWRVFRFITFSHEADWVMTQPRIWLPSVPFVTRLLTDNDNTLSKTF